MSDREVLLAIEEMEGLLKEESVAIDPDHLIDWQSRFHQALTAAERGDGWSEITARAKAVNALLEDRLRVLIQQRDAIRRELEGQALGQRALKAYDPTKVL